MFEMTFILKRTKKSIHKNETNSVKQLDQSDAITTYVFSVCNNCFDSFAKFIFVVSID